MKSLRWFLEEVLLDARDVVAYAAKGVISAFPYVVAAYSFAMVFLVAVFVTVLLLGGCSSLSTEQQYYQELHWSYCYYPRGAAPDQVTFDYWQQLCALKEQQ